jgi:hypothetical protein
MAHQDMARWQHIVNEAYEGSTMVDRTMTQSQLQYGREAAQYKLPTDYPQIKTVADLLQSLDRYIDAAEDSIKNPLARAVIGRIKRTNPTRAAVDLDRLAKAPEKPATGR